MKEVVISTSGVNCYGSRVLTEGIDLTQFEKNPLLLWMHRRSYEGDAMPIGRVENLRIDDDRLIGTPVFDQSDEFAKKIEGKWENGFLRMASAGIEILELSDAPEHLVQGQTRATVTRCRLEEVSIVDIGGNNEALQLYDKGRMLKLAAGEDNDALPLLELKKKENPPAGTAPDGTNDNKQKTGMNKEIMQLLGLADDATEQEAVGAVRLLKEKADKAESLTLAGITAIVDGAVAEKRITADKKEHFINLGKNAGVECLRATLEMMRPTHKPTEVINPKDTPASGEPKAFAKLSEVPSEQMEKLRKDNPAEYMRLYKAEYGVEAEI